MPYDEAEFEDSGGEEPIDPPDWFLLVDTLGNELARCTYDEVVANGQLAIQLEFKVRREGFISHVVVVWHGYEERSTKPHDQITILEGYQTGPGDVIVLSLTLPR